MSGKTPTLVDGLSLVEVLVALLIFSGILLTAALMALKSLNIAREGFYHLQAADLAQMQQESIRAYGLKNLAQWQAHVATVLPQGEGRVILPPQGKYVTIEVQWRSPNSPSHLYQKHSMTLPCFYDSAL